MLVHASLTPISDVGSTPTVSTILRITTYKLMNEECPSKFYTKKDLPGSYEWQALEASHHYLQVDERRMSFEVLYEEGPSRELEIASHLVSETEGYRF
jgi:hypothetical protein